MSDLKQLMRNFPFPGKLEWIGIRPSKRAALEACTSVDLSAENGIIGDHYKGTSGKRQVTLIQAENIAIIAQLLQKDAISPALLRRNFVVSGINLHALMDKTVQIGEEVILEITGPCHPCSRMEENLGFGGYNAMRNKGGITARVIKGGAIHLGDKIHFIAEQTA